VTFILGINAYHGDSSACLIREGAILAAAEEERFRRIKHWAGFPSEAIRYCLAEAKITLADVHHVAINQNSHANLFRKIAFAIRSRPDLGHVLARLRNRRKRSSIDAQLGDGVPGSSFRGKVHHVEHHLAHLASAFIGSPFPEASAISVDGFGDFASAAWGIGRGSHVQVEEKVYFPHSLGVFYQALTQYLGFPHYGDEYKVMGLAPYGKPLHTEALERVVELQSDGTYRLNLAYFRHASEHVDYTWENGAPAVGKLYTAALEQLLGPARDPKEDVTQRHRDLARSVQATYERAFFHLLRAVHKRHGLDALALAGGCAMNSVANGKVYANTPFRRLYVQAAAGDAGGAIGAALAVWGKLEGRAAKRLPVDHAYWGPSYDHATVQALLEGQGSSLESAGCEVERIGNEADLCGRTAKAVCEGSVVGWFQGRMEWGPRALGNRSIVCDPRRKDMKEILNLKIKRRESFRPFAPSVLREAVPEWFETDDDVPFMMQVYQIRAEKRPLIPAVTHVDGSGRLQTVTRDANPLYYRLIESFRDATGVPMVLNTSFNENEPVVCTPSEALDCFLRTRMDMLVLGNHVVTRRAA
jgi:carbamoyltransferase